MTLLHPRTEPTPVDVHTDAVTDTVTRDAEAEALIREARHLRRRRWTIGLLVVAVVGAGIGWTVASSSPTSSTPTPRPARPHVIARAFRPGLPVGPYAHLKVAGPLAVAPTGALYVADVVHQRVLVRLPGGRFRVIAGSGKKGVAGDGGPAIDAAFVDIMDMAVGSDGSLYVVDGGRVRVVSPTGVISTVAGLPGVTKPPSDGPGTLPPLIANGTPARSVSIDPLGTAAIALSEQGVLYVSTGLQLLRLDAGALDVTSTRGVDPPYVDRPLDNLGQIALDAQGDLYVSGGNGWAIWRVAPNGTATAVDPKAKYEARRSGGNTSVLERGPDGAVYGESGGRLLHLQGDRATLGYTFPSTRRSYFWLTYFAFAPDGTVYADEIPGSGGFERYQQLRVVRGTRTSVLWHQTAADVPPPPPLP